MPCSPRMRSCSKRNPGCGHAALVAAYQDWRLWWDLRREQENPGMYAAELIDWERDNPQPTFKEFLIHSRRLEIAA